MLVGHAGGRFPEASTADAALLGLYWREISRPTVRRARLTRLAEAKSSGRTAEGEYSPSTPRPALGYTFRDESFLFFSLLSPSSRISAGRLWQRRGERNEDPLSQRKDFQVCRQVVSSRRWP